MKKLRFLSLALAMLMILAIFTGCGKAVDKNKNVVNAEFTEYLIAEKVGTLDIENFMTDEGGIYYKGENNLYGVISFNGVHDTGTIYTSVKPVGKFFQVTTKTISDSNDFAGLNSHSLIDGKGKTIIPEGYANFLDLNDRFVKMAKVTKRSYSKDEAVMGRDSETGYCSDGYFNDDCDLYAGEWYVFDTVLGKIVPGATGTKNTSVSAKGRYVQFNDENKNYVSIDENGEPLPEGAKLFEDGSYSIEGKIGEVFDPNGEFLFNFDLTGFKPYNVNDGYYIASKYTDNATKHVVMNNKGEVISSEFDEYIYPYGEIIECGEKIYNREGKCVLEGTYESVHFDKMFEQNWIVRNDDYYTMIDKDGNVFFNGPDDDDHSVFTSDFLASKKIDDEYYYYSFKDQDYTIKGHHFAPWIVKTPNDNFLYDLVDTMTGKTLLEGYKNYSCISRNSLAYYVYAKYNGGADIYLIVSGAQLENVINKKTNLFDDLSTAFKNEGIEVTVNKETGEIALDSSVLFGGDSAELTADGKAFLNKFIKAYTTVAFSDKYEGFISKTMVEGHTAPVAGSTYASGLQLSEERALNVKNYCLSSDTGVDVSKIAQTLEDVGYSNSKPVYNANGEVDLAASRRVSFRFLVNVDF